MFNIINYFNWRKESKVNTDNARRRFSSEVSQWITQIKTAAAKTRNKSLKTLN
jgi:hypothetical protein